MQGAWRKVSATIMEICQSELIGAASEPSDGLPGPLEGQAPVALAHPPGPRGCREQLIKINALTSVSQSRSRHWCSGGRGHAKASILRGARAPSFARYPGSDAAPDVCPWFRRLFAPPPRSGQSRYFSVELFVRVCTKTSGWLALCATAVLTSHPHHHCPPLLSPVSSSHCGNKIYSVLTT